MSFPTSDRLKAWYESHEVHFAVARPGGDVQIGIAPTVGFESDSVLVLNLPVGVWDVVQPYLAASQWIALHPGGLGAVKAPYQLKGTVRPVGDGQPATEDGFVQLHVDLLELYITKPGPEAGQRVDHWTKDELTEFERSLGWLDDGGAP